MLKAKYRIKYFSIKASYKKLIIKIFRSEVIFNHLIIYLRAPDLIRQHPHIFLTLLKLEMKATQKIKMFECIKMLDKLCLSMQQSLIKRQQEIYKKVFNHLMTDPRPLVYLSVSARGIPKSLVLGMKHVRSTIL